MDWKKIGKKILYPHIAIILILFPISVAFLTFSLVYLTTKSVIAIFAYLIAFYELLVICLRVPNIVKFVKKVKHENKYAVKYFSDVNLRVNISLYGSLFWNVAYGIFQLGLGFYHNSFWYYSLFGYYVMLAVMRFFLVNHTRNYKPGEETDKEIKKCHICGWILLAMNIALAVITFFFVYLDKTFVHHEIITITMAAYTFTTFTFAIVNNVRYRKYNSPVYNSAKNITLVSACVSMLMLENTMLTTFGADEGPLFRQLMLAITGVVVSAVTIFVAMRMIIKKPQMSQKKILQNESNAENIENKKDLI